MTVQTLTPLALNRATLARQFLLERTDLPLRTVLQQLVALQGQDSDGPYFGLWSRMRDFDRAALTALLERRDAVRAPAFRATLHIMLAEDYLLMQQALRAGHTRHLDRFAEPSLEPLRAFLEAQPRTGAELRARLAELHPDLGALPVLDSLRMRLSLLQIPPAGTWGFAGRPAHALAESWLGRPLADAGAGLQPLVKRYLAAFGPARVADIQKWSGLTRLQAVVDQLRPELLTFRDEQGRELFDLPGAPRPAADTPAPVRFLPQFENVLLAYAERGRFLAERDFPAVFTSNGIVKPTFLVDGFVRGTWKLEQGALALEPFAPLAPQVERSLRDEGERLRRWCYA